MQAGPYEADLRGGLLMKRIALSGQGKSGGFRTLVATNKGSKFDKNGEEALKKMASHLLSLSPPGLSTAQRAGELMEVNYDAQS